MAVINYEKLLVELVKPLVANPEEVEAIIVDSNEAYCKVKINVNKDDLGRIIGRKGRIANAIRTIAHAAAIRDGVKLEIDLDSQEIEEE